jgi:hypothetical protein
MVTGGGAATAGTAPPAEETAASNTPNQRDRMTEL